MFGQTKLSETTNITKPEKATKVGEHSFFEVPAIGDGNCAFNSFALALIDLIKQDKLKKENADRFLRAIQENEALLVLDERLKLYKREESGLVGNAYSDLADSLTKHIQFFKTHPSFEQLCDYVKAQQTREEIAALHVAFAPALRKLGVDSYVELLKTEARVDDPSLMSDAQYRYGDGVEAGEEALSPLAKVFQINLVIYDREKKAADISFRQVSTSSRIENEPEVTLLHVPGHWNYLLPETSTKGLAAHLSPEIIPTPAPLIKQEKEGVLKELDENTTLLVFQQEKSAQFEKAVTDNKTISHLDIKEVALVAKQLSENLLELGSVADVLSETKDEILKQSKAAAKSSHEEVKSVIKQVKLTEEKIAKVTPHTYEQDILKAAMSDSSKPAVDSDEALARSLQNAEVLDFLNRHYHVLSPHRETFATKRMRTSVENKDELASPRINKPQ